MNGGTYVPLVPSAEVVAQHIDDALRRMMIGQVLAPLRIIARPRFKLDSRARLLRVATERQRNEQVIGFVYLGLGKWHVDCQRRPRAMRAIAQL
ncbi:hypothetical protein WL90_22945 [Burkholderia cenocepacia]|nr:hypothetical protein WL90_22945 [Burkholderia cenocepacia]KWF75111.1 hypothetical protein WL89_03775 [Burkholderia cenocepacia]